ncbi:MAG: hypothetical protein ACOX8B_06415 [Lachnospiraceae bacterium]|jgi:putative aldouronate transport system substrate-binding protein
MKKRVMAAMGIALAATMTVAGGSGIFADEETTEASDESYTSEGGITYPIDTDAEVSWYAQDALIPHEKYADASESPFHIGLAKHLGVTIDWSFPTTGSDGGSYTNTLLADPESLPNIMYAYFMANADQYIDDGIIWDLTPYIEEYAPDYYAWLQEDPTRDRAMKTDSGRYYCFGFFREDGGWNDTYQGPVVRKDWLEECGLEVPTTISEFENVIRVFNEKYGATFDSAYAVRWKQMGVTGAFGAYGNALVDSSWGWYIDDDGKVQLAQAQPEWRDYMSWLNKLWEDGLIDQDIMSEDDTTIKDKIHNGQCGISLTSMGQMNNWNKEEVAAGGEEIWEGIPYPTADDGSISSVFGGPGIGTSTTVITKTADEETMKLCLQMLNYAYTDEGRLYWNYGDEGVSWEYDENGVPQFTSLVTDDQDTDPMTKYNGATWNGPDIQLTNLLYLKNSDAAIAANDTWYYIYPDDMEKNTEVTSGWKWPVGVTFTTEESDELDEISGNIGIYVEESYAAFLNGSKDIDDDEVWNQYLADLETYNLSRILEIRQASYDRYIAR